MTDKLTVIDMFSGIGGFSLGLERTGQYETIVFCENNEFCQRVLADHWPGVPILGDVTQIIEFPAADVIVGGFPCQDVSIAGKRAGITGERSGLYRELVRAIRLVRPDHAILENVAELLTDGMGDVLGDLAESGDCVEWDCVPACSLGAPHQRDRVWIVAHAPRIDDGCGDGTEKTRQEPEFGSGAGAATVADTQGIGCRPGRTRRPPDSFAWIRNATRGDAADADDKRFHRACQGETVAAQKVISEPSGHAWWDVWQQTWPREPALLGMDVRLPDGMERTKALGNTLIPQIPELIGRAILAERGR